MRRVLVLLSGLLLLAPPGVAHAEVEPVRTMVSTAGLLVETYDYAGAGDSERTVDVYSEPGADTGRWMVTLHGGSWAAGYKANADEASRIFQAAGFTVFNVEYRKTSDYGANTGVPWARQRDDVLDAVEWIKGHAGQFGIDPDRGAIYGFSAGGHLAASVGLQGNGSARFDAIVSASGVLQPDRVWYVAHSDPDVGYAGDFPTSPNKNLAGWAAVAMRCPLLTTWADCSSRWYDFRPDKKISPDDPPMMIFQGTTDPSVPPATGRSFDYWLGQEGVPSTLIECVGWGHNEACALDGGWRQQQMIDFVREETA